VREEGKEEKEDNPQSSQDILLSTKISRQSDWR